MNHNKFKEVKKMSIDIFYDYKFKGKSEDLARMLRDHFSWGYFFAPSLGISYPESLSFDLQYGPERIIDEGITEMTVTILIIKRMHFDIQDIEDLIYEEFRNQYPNLEVSYEFSDEN